MFDFLKRFDRQMWIAAKVMRAHIWMEMVLCDNMADMSQNGECAYVACSAQTKVSPPPSNLDDLQKRWLPCSSPGYHQLIWVEILVFVKS